MLLSCKYIIYFAKVLKIQQTEIVLFKFSSLSCHAFCCAEAYDAELSAVCLTFCDKQTIFVCTICICAPFHPVIAQPHLLYNGGLRVGVWHRPQVSGAYCRHHPCTHHTPMMLLMPCGRICGQRFTLDVNIPVGTTATIYKPGQHKSKTLKVGRHTLKTRRKEK